MELRPYQREAISAIFKEWNDGIDKILAVMPTGCGKTIVFAITAEDLVRQGKRVLILAHRGELLEQAADKIKKATGLICAVEKAELAYINENSLVAAYEQSNQNYDAYYTNHLIEINTGKDAPIGYVYDWDKQTFNPPPEIVVPVIDSIQEAIAMKCDEINSCTERAITSGFDFKGEHYSLTIADQTNISDLAFAIGNGMSAVPYHADGEECRVFTAVEFMELYTEYNKFKLECNTYCNLLKMQVRAYTDIEKINSVKYRVAKLEGEFAERYNDIVGLLL